MVKPEERRDVSGASCVDVPAEVEDVLEATEALWAARRRLSSRVKRLTWEESRQTHS
jgi:hypothetical protein